MGGKSQSAPPPPDYVGAANAQAGASRDITEQQTWANRPDQYNPWGSVEWDNQQVWDPATEQYLNRWSQTTNLDPQAQWALDNQMYLQGARSELGGQMMDRARDEYGQEMDWSQFGDWTGIDRPEAGGKLDIQGGIDTGGMQGVDVGQGTQLPQGGEYSPEEIQRQLGEGAQYTPEEIQRQLGQTPEEIRNRAEQSIYDRSTSRLDPQWQQSEDDTRSRLIAQGLRPGDAAFDREMENMGRQKQDAYQTAMTESIMGGGQEGQRQYDQMLGSGNFANQASQQAMAQQMGIGSQQFQEQAARGQMDLGQQQQMFSQQSAERQRQFMEESQQRGMSNEEADQEWKAGEQQRQQDWQNQMGYADYQNNLRQNQIKESMMQRGFSLNEINALISGQQVNTPQFEGFNQAQRSETPQYMDAADKGYQGALQSYSMDQANNPMGDLFQMGGQLGSAYLMAGSDRRLKTNIKRIGKTPGGTNLYSWRYIWGEDSVGVMADEVPWAAVDGPGGFKYVDYGRIR